MKFLGWECQSDHVPGLGLIPTTANYGCTCVDDQCPLARSIHGPCTGDSGQPLLCTVCGAHSGVGVGAVGSLLLGLSLRHWGKAHSLQSTTHSHWRENKTRADVMSAFLLRELINSNQERNQEHNCTALGTASGQLSPSPPRPRPRPQDCPPEAPPGR